MNDKSYYYIFSKFVNLTKFGIDVKHSIDLEINGDKYILIMQKGNTPSRLTLEAEVVFTSGGDLLKNRNGTNTCSDVVRILDLALESKIKKHNSIEDSVDIYNNLVEIKFLKKISDDYKMFSKELDYL
jgi:hypothetical protein